MRRVGLWLRSWRQQPGAPVLSALLWLASAGCTDRTRSDGEACTRSTECAVGLACVEGACSADLTPLEDPSRVPMLTPAMPDAAMTPAPDAATQPPPPPPPPPLPATDAGAMSPPPPVPDAAVTTDAGGG